MCRNGMETRELEVRRSGQISCLAIDKPQVAVLVLSYFATRKIANISCYSVDAPSLLQINYPELAAESKRRRSMVTPTKR
jgi:hypothetical protein